MAGFLIGQVRVKSEGLRRLQQRLIEAGAVPSAGNPLADMYKQWGKRYLAQVKRRFVKLSRSGGGGEWAPLKMSTILRRRFSKGGTIGGSLGKTFGQQFRRNPKIAQAARQKMARLNLAVASAAILRNTGVILNALDIGDPGNAFQLDDGGIFVGFSAAAHPGGKANIAQIASYHDQGLGHLPRRQILVPPDAATLKGMEEDARRVFPRLGQ